MNWINDDIELIGKSVEIRPLGIEHFDALKEIAKDKRIWEFYAVNGTDPEKLTEALNLAFVEKEKGIQFPFVIFHKTENKIIGSTRFLDLVPVYKKLEIGWTWLDPAYWATEINPECKLLLLTYCFETLGTIRVTIKTSDINIRSRKAIEKIGGKFEGILRNDMIRDNGTKRNSAYYSIIDDEWPETKIKLTALVESKITAKLKNKTL